VIEVISVQHIPYNARLRTLRAELETELQRILQYWIDFSMDDVNDGFIGRIDNNNQVDLSAPKGLVLNARILWTFSAAYRLTGNRAYLDMAERAYDYLNHFFLDREHGGYYWSVEIDGNVKESRKQIYGIAFCLYGLTEYYRATNHPEALQAAHDCFTWIERYSFDAQYGGYIEAFTRDWQPITDQRLSEKDANEKKTMNTHLHILEAYTNLYRVWQGEVLKDKIVLLLENFSEHIVDPETGHLHLFFREDWSVQSGLVSYGHDIEAAWLLPEAARVISDSDAIDSTRIISQQLARAAKEGLHTEGGIWYEKDGEILILEKHWWPQAEAMVGFFHAWQTTGNEEYLEAVFNTWEFVKRVLIDRENGEWFWGSTADNGIMAHEDKAGFWKCPYHNSRACFELIARIDHLLNR
jgi:mannobiose 2-epimerase